MNSAFQTVITSSRDDRRQLFLTAATRLNTAIQNVEKDFWVSWMLDALFNGVAKGAPRLLFKGGTSLSKGFGLIERFSEDIDITVFRDDLGENATAEELEGLSKGKREAKLDAIRAACQKYMNGPLTDELAALISATMKGAAIDPASFSLEADPDDPEKQSLLFRYPTVADEDAYVQAVIKVESGAKSAFDPHVERVIRPYVDDDAPDLDLQVPHVTTVVPQRTFWDKVVMLHGLRQWYDRREELRHGGQRVSRHYYDVHRLMAAEGVDAWVADYGLAADCARHARVFFARADLGLSLATRGSFTLVPTDPMREALTRDYELMSGMIFGKVPALGDVLRSVRDLEARINA